MAAPRTLKLLSKSGSVFEVEQDVLKKSALIQTLLADADGSDEAIPLPSVDDRELARIVEFLKKNKEDPILRICRPLRVGPLTNSAVPKWADDFINSVPLPHLIDLIEAASALQIKMLEFLGCAKVAHVVKNLPKGKLQEIYGVTQAMSPEEEAELKAANEWAWKHQESDVVDEDEGVTASAAADTAPAAAAEAK